MAGNSTIVPVPADYDGDGRTDLAYYYPASGGWYIVPSTTGVGQVTGWGNTEMAPVPADYDGDGKTDIAVYYPFYGAFYVYPSTSQTGYAIVTGVNPAAVLVLRKPQ
ncbi:hypothetical protein BH18ACI5_BH18ACI5_10620 [soil metagenome]